MGKEFEALEAKLDFACGQVHALKTFLAAFMAVSQERANFVAAIPTIEDMLESHTLPSAASDNFLSGAREVCDSMKLAADKSQAAKTHPQESE